MQRIKSFENGSICYLVATPVGNLEDFSPRAKNILSSVDIIACEDTRTTSTLLRYFSINKPLISYHEHNEQECSSRLIAMLEEGKSVAIVSDAGYPGISDPGSIMVRHCIEHNIPVSIIPGANAFLPALVGSGLDTSHFYFHGFLSSKPSLRRKELEGLTSVPVTMIFYESPHRIMETLEDMYKILGNRQIVLTREITKIHEERIIGTLEELSSIDKDTIRGEMVLVVEGSTQKEKTYSEEDLISMIKEEMENGASMKDACKKVAQSTGEKKNYLYQLMLEKDA